MKQMNPIRQDDRQGKPDLTRGIPSRVQPRGKPLAELLREGRLAAGLDIKQASQETGISTGMLSTLEQGKQASTSIDKLMTMASAYDLDATALIEAAGYDLTPALPNFTPYLRSKYRNIPRQAQDEIAAAFERITQKYGIDPHQAGPDHGQDEDYPNIEENRRQTRQN